MLKDIHARVPVDGTARRVTGQSGCQKDDALNPERVRENLVLRVKRIDSMLAAPLTKDERKKLGREKAALCSQINSIRPKSKTPGISQFVIDILREEMTKAQFDILFKKARKRWEEAQENG